MGTTAWYVADTSGIRWARASVPGTGGVLPVEVVHLGSAPPWSTWMVRRTAFEADRVEDWFVRQLARAEGTLLAHMLDEEFAALTAVAGGTVVARAVAGRAEAYEQGRSGIERAAAHHGGAWREAALDRLAMWSHLAPAPAGVPALRRALESADADGDRAGDFVLGLFRLLGLPVAGDGR